MTSMDFMPDIEFHILFRRISNTIDLEGCATPQEVNSRLKQRINEYKAHGVTPFGNYVAYKKIAALRNLVAGGFGRRTIAEAMAKPHGEVALTLKYGRETARRILTRRKRIM